MIEIERGKSESLDILREARAEDVSSGSVDVWMADEKTHDRGHWPYLYVTYNAISRRRLHVQVVRMQRWPACEAMQSLELHWPRSRQAHRMMTSANGKFRASYCQVKSKQDI